MSSKNFVYADQGAWEKTDPGVQRKLLGYDNDLMMVHVMFEKGAVGYLHRHPHRQATFVVEGSFEVNLENEKRVLKKGDSFFMLPNTVHGVTALEAGSLIDAFTPAREDFLKK